jgi:hypothetical protein
VVDIVAVQLFDEEIQHKRGVGLLASHGLSGRWTVKKLTGRFRAIVR